MDLTFGYGLATNEADITLTDTNLTKINEAVATIEIVGARYNEPGQKMVNR